MARAHSAWKALDGAECVDSSDESWLNQSQFYLSDDEDDETHSLTAQAYVHAVAALKGAGLQRQHLPYASQHQPLLLELPSICGPASKPVVPLPVPTAPARLAEQVQKQVKNGSLLPQVQSQGPAAGYRTVPSETLPPATAQEQHTMQALEMLFPQELLTAQPALPVQKTASHSGAVDTKHKSASSQAASVSTQPARAAVQLQQPRLLPQSHTKLPSVIPALPTATPAITAVSASLPTVRAALPPVTFAAAAPSFCHLPQQQPPQKLASPASKAAALPFTGAVPGVLANQQQQQERGLHNTTASGQQQIRAVAAEPAAPVSPLQLSLSAEQIALLKAAANNAQRYLDRDTESAGNNQDRPSAGGTTTDATAEQTGQWDMQSAIIDAFKSILPTESEPNPCPPSAQPAAPTDTGTEAAQSAPLQGQQTQTDSSVLAKQAQLIAAEGGTQLGTVPLPTQATAAATQANQLAVEPAAPLLCLAALPAASEGLPSAQSDLPSPSHALSLEGQSLPATSQGLPSKLLDLPTTSQDQTSGDGAAEGSSFVKAAKAQRRKQAQKLKKKLTSGAADADVSSTSTPSDPPAAGPPKAKLTAVQPSCSAISVPPAAAAEAARPVVDGSPASEPAATHSAAVQAAKAVASAAVVSLPPASTAAAAAAAANLVTTAATPVGTAAVSITTAAAPIATAAASTTAPSKPSASAFAVSTATTSALTPATAPVLISQQGAPPTVPTAARAAAPKSAAAIPAKGAAASSQAVASAVRTQPSTAEANTQAPTAAVGHQAPTAAASHQAPSAAVGHPAPTAAVGHQAPTAAVNHQAPTAAARTPALEAATSTPSDGPVSTSIQAAPTVISKAASNPAAADAVNPTPSNHTDNPWQSSTSQTPASGAAAAAGLVLPANDTSAVLAGAQGKAAPSKGKHVPTPFPSAACVRTAPQPIAIPSSLAAFLIAHAPLALLQDSSMPMGSVSMPAPLPSDAGVHLPRAVSQSIASLGLGALPAKPLPHEAVSYSPASLSAGAVPAGLLPRLPVTLTPGPAPVTTRPQIPAHLIPGPVAVQGFSQLPASPSLFSPAQQATKPLVGKAPASKKRNREEAQLTQTELPSATPTHPSDSPHIRQIPAAFTPGKQPHPSATPSNSTPKQTPDSASRPKKLHSDPYEGVSAAIATMRRAHGNNAIPQVGAEAVIPQLKTVQSLVTHKQYKYNLLEICTTIGYFAIGHERKAEIFLGDLHNSFHHQQQIHSVANLFGVRAFQSDHPERFHDKYHLTCLVRTADAGILTRHGDMLVYFILELAELTKLNNKQVGDMYLRENKATLELANAVGRKLKGDSPNSLNKGCQIRLQQLSDKGYLAVKRPKGKQQKPACYPGWEGRPRYGPPTSTSLPPPKPQLPLPASPQHLQAAPAAASAGKQQTPAATAAPAPARQKSGPEISTGIGPAPTHPALTPSTTKAPAATAADHSTAVAERLVPVTGSMMPTASASPVPFAPTASASPVPFAPIPSVQHPPVRESHAAAAPPMPYTEVSPAPQATALRSAVPPPSNVTRTTQHPVPIGGHSQRPLSDTTAALVAAVGPLFEAFVAQTQAVVSDPSVSLQDLAGSITQELAAAIATAAVQVVEARRQHSTAVLRNAATAATAAAVSTSMAATVPALMMAASAPALAQRDVPAGGSNSKMPEAHMSDAAGLTATTATAAAAVAAFVPAAAKAASTSAAASLPGDAGASGSGTQSSGVSELVQGMDRKTASPVGKKTTKSLSPSDGNGRVRGSAKAADASPDKAASSGSKRQLKRQGSDAKAATMSDAKRQRTGVTTHKGAVEFEGYVVPRLDVNKYEPSKAKAQTPSNPKQVSGEQAKGGKGSKLRSSGSQRSRGSDKSSPVSGGLLHASSQSVSQTLGSPQGLSRHNSGSPFQPGPGRFGSPSGPSRLSGNFGSGSPLMGPALPFPLQVPMSDAQLSQSMGSLDFRPMGTYPGMSHQSPDGQSGAGNGFVPLMPVNHGDWQTQPLGLNAFPFPAAHLLPGIGDAPDFSPVNWL